MKKKGKEKKEDISLSNLSLGNEGEDFKGGELKIKWPPRKDMFRRRRRRWMEGKTLSHFFKFFPKDVEIYRLVSWPPFFFLLFATKN
jgi:hypothetical protein